MALPLSFRYAFRQMFKKPLFAAAIVLTLSVCIGAITAVFSVVDATLLRPLPYPQPDRLAQLVIRMHSNEGEGLQQYQNGATWEQFAKSIATLDLAVYRGSTENLNFSSGRGDRLHTSTTGRRRLQSRDRGCSADCGRVADPQLQVPVQSRAGYGYNECDHGELCLAGCALFVASNGLRLFQRSVAPAAQHSRRGRGSSRA